MCITWPLVILLSFCAWEHIALGMGIATNSIHKIRRVTAVLLSCAMLLSLLVPAGFMPDTSGGSFRIKLCSGVQDATLTIDSNHPQYELLALVHGVDVDMSRDHAPDAEEMRDCAFSAGAGLALAPPSAPVLDIAQYPVTIPAIPRALQYIGRALHLPPSTGPPAFG